MANPQKENGFVSIANELYDALLDFPFSGQEFRGILFVIRKTYGFNRKEDWISLSQFAKALKITRIRACQILKPLKEKKVLRVTEKRNSTPVKYMINKDFEKWVRVTEKRKVTEKRNQGLRKNVIKGYGKTKDIISTKDTLTKDTLTKEKNTSLFSSSQFSSFHYLKNETFIKAYKGYLEMRKQKNKQPTDYAHKLALIKLHKHPIETAILMLEQSILNAWTGIFELKTSTDKKQRIGVKWDDVSPPIID